MKALVIYDSTGRIWSIVYGEENIPQGLTCMFVDIPDGAILDHIDVTDSANPQPVFNYLPESDVGRLQDEVNCLKSQVTNLDSQLTDAYIALTEQYEANLVMEEDLINTQMALCEVYELYNGGV